MCTFFSRIFVRRRKFSKNAKKMPDFRIFWRAPPGPAPERPPEPLPGQGPVRSLENPVFFDFFRLFDPSWVPQPGAAENPVFRPKSRLFPDFRQIRRICRPRPQIRRICSPELLETSSELRHHRARLRAPSAPPTLPSTSPRDDLAQVGTADEPGPPKASSDSSSTESPSVDGLADPTVSSALLARRRSRLHRRRSRRAHSSDVVGDPVTETRLVSLADLSVPVGDYRDDRSRRAESALPIPPRRERCRQVVPLSAPLTSSTITVGVSGSPR